MQFLDYDSTSGSDTDKPSSSMALAKSLTLPAGNGAHNLNSATCGVVTDNENVHTHYDTSIAGASRWTILEDSSDSEEEIESQKQDDTDNNCVEAKKRFESAEVLLSSLSSKPKFLSKVTDVFEVSSICNRSYEQEAGVSNAQTDSEMNGAAMNAKPVQIATSTHRPQSSSSNSTNAEAITSMGKRGLPGTAASNQHGAATTAKNKETAKVINFERT